MNYKNYTTKSAVKITTIQLSDYTKASTNE